MQNNDSKSQRYQFEIDELDILFALHPIALEGGPGGFVDNACGWVNDRVDDFCGGVSNLADNTLGLLSDPMSVLSDPFGSLNDAWDSFVEFHVDLYEDIKEAHEEAWEEVCDAWESVKASCYDAWQDVCDVWDDWGKQIIGIVAVVVLSWTGVGAVLAAAIVGALQAGMESGWDLQAMAVGAIAGAATQGCGGSIWGRAAVGALKSGYESGWDMETMAVGATAGALSGKGGGSLAGKAAAGALKAGHASDWDVSKMSEGALVGAASSYAKGKLKLDENGLFGSQIAGEYTQNVIESTLDSCVANGLDRDAVVIGIANGLGDSVGQSAVATYGSDSAGANNVIYATTSSAVSSAIVATANGEDVAEAVGKSTSQAAVRASLESLSYEVYSQMPGDEGSGKLKEYCKVATDAVVAGAISTTGGGDFGEAFQAKFTNDLMRQAGQDITEKINEYKTVKREEQAAADMIEPGGTHNDATASVHTSNEQSAATDIDPPANVNDPIGYQTNDPQNAFVSEDFKSSSPENSTNPEVVPAEGRRSNYYYESSDDFTYTSQMLQDSDKADTAPKLDPFLGYAFETEQNTDFVNYQQPSNNTLNVTQGTSAQLPVDGHDEALNPDTGNSGLVNTGPAGSMVPSAMVFDDMSGVITDDSGKKNQEEKLLEAINVAERKMQEAERYQYAGKDWKVIEARNDYLAAKDEYERVVGASVYTFREDVKDFACQTLDNNIKLMDAEKIKYQDTNSTVYDDLRKAIPVDLDLKKEEDNLSAVLKAKERKLHEAEMYPSADKEWKVIDARSEYFEAKDNYDSIADERSALHANYPALSALKVDKITADTSNAEIYSEMTKGFDKIKPEILEAKEKIRNEDVPLETLTHVIDSVKQKPKYTDLQYDINKWVESEKLTDKQIKVATTGISATAGLASWAHPVGWFGKGAAAVGTATGLIGSGYNLERSLDSFDIAQSQQIGTPISATSLETAKSDVKWAMLDLGLSGLDAAAGVRAARMGPDAKHIDNISGRSYMDDIRPKMTPLSNSELDGILTSAERVEVEAIAKKYNTEIHIVGSRSAGEGRNIDTEYPVGKGDVSRSDIDFRIDTEHALVDDLMEELNMVGKGAGNASLKHGTNHRETYPPYITIKPSGEIMSVGTK